MNIINLTPHAIVLRTAEGLDVVLPPSVKAARVTSIPGDLRDAGLPVPVQGSPAYGPVEGLPAPEEGTAFVVSGLVLSRCAGRVDVFGPGTGPEDGAVRDEKNRIIAVTRLIAAPMA